MGKPISIDETVDTKYFGKVQPTWAKPRLVRGNLFQEVCGNLPPGKRYSLVTREEREELQKAIKSGLVAAGYGVQRFSEIWCESIEEKFHPAAKALAAWNPQRGDWKSDSWAMHPDNPFFTVRGYLIEAAKAVGSKDWYAKVKTEHDFLKRIPPALSKLVLSTRAWHDLMPSEESAAFLEFLQVRRDQLWWTGVIQWNSLPNSLHDRSTLAGMMLANEVLLVMEHIGGQLGQLFHQPLALLRLDSLSLPWHAISLFMQAVGVECDSAALRTKVTKVWPQVSRYYTPAN